MYAGDCSDLRQADRLCESGMEVFANTTQPWWFAAVALRCLPRYRYDELVHACLDREQRNTVGVTSFEIEPPGEQCEAWRFHVPRRVEDARLASNFVERAWQKLD